MTNSFAEAQQQRAGKYFLMHLLRDGRKVPIIVWNGIRDYENPVPPYVIANEPSFATTTKIGIVQIGKPFGTGTRRSARRLVNALPFDGIILWARDSRVYDSAVEEFRTYAVADMENVGGAA
jgi:hypothetical protein